MAMGLNSGRVREMGMQDIKNAQIIGPDVGLTQNVPANGRFIKGYMLELPVCGVGLDIWAFDGNQNASREQRFIEAQARSTYRSQCREESVWTLLARGPILVNGGSEHTFAEAPSNISFRV